MLFRLNVDDLEEKNREYLMDYLYPLARDQKDIADNIINSKNNNVREKTVKYTGTSIEVKKKFNQNYIVNNKPIISEEENNKIVQLIQKTVELVYNESHLFKPIKLAFNNKPNENRTFSNSNDKRNSMNKSLNRAKSALIQPLTNVQIIENKDEEDNSNSKDNDNSNEGNENVVNKITRKISAYDIFKKRSSNIININDGNSELKTNIKSVSLSANKDGNFTGITKDNFNKTSQFSQKPTRQSSASNFKTPFNEKKSLETKKTKVKPKKKSTLLNFIEFSNNSIPIQKELKYIRESKQIAEEKLNRSLNKSTKSLRSVISSNNNTIISQKTNNWDSVTELKKVKPSQGWYSAYNNSFLNPNLLLPKDYKIEKEKALKKQEKICLKGSVAIALKKWEDTGISNQYDTGNFNIPFVSSIK